MESDGTSPTLWTTQDPGMTSRKKIATGAVVATTRYRMSPTEVTSSFEEPIEKATEQAVLRIEKGETIVVETRVPPHQAGLLLLTGGNLAIMGTVVLAPMTTIAAAPSEWPVWATAGIILCQLALPILMIMRTPPWRSTNDNTS
ncbi:hypothetical protein JOD54_005610 [Actinokineospora baliensis]|uniref:hypothetical protein n=1 Tax=Actinokineospora baliensis TaxID=547056 RepID=UPI00195829C6|nr:hypothetical protein [Actinokineospora baliensis]MBM7775406.1 hypothetical protein [Actinokineospora baliensis]